MSGEESVGPAGSSVLLARIFELLRGVREQQRRDGVQLERVSGLLLGLADQVRRLDRRIGEQKDDLEMMLKMELMGQFEMQRTEFGHRLDELADRIAALEGGNPWRLGTGSS